MTASIKPSLAVYVAWHPSFSEGRALAKHFFEHYRRNLYQNVSGGTGMSVIYRSEPEAGSVVPIDVAMDEAETTAVILLIDKNWAESTDWIAWAKRHSDRANKMGLRAFVFPVAIDQKAIDASVVLEQAIRWDTWATDSHNTKLRRMFTALSYEFCRMLRQYLARPQQPAVSDEDLEDYLKKVDVFVSHSKHDNYGVAIAKEIRRFVQDAGYGAFFDVYDIPSGQRFDRVLLLKVKKSAVVAVHTDSYSSREWCRKEMIQAKKNHVPVVVADCIADIDERGFPYMANVPIIRMDPGKIDRIDAVVGRLVDEVLKDFLWRCRVTLFDRSGGATVAFVPRPPELIILTALKATTPSPDVLVYPDPPIGTEELELFATAAPEIKLLSATEYLAGASI